MSLSPKISLDRWLIWSDAAFQSLTQFWRVEAGPSSLLQWRFSNDLATRAPRKELRAHIASLAPQEFGQIFVVINEADTEFLHWVEDVNLPPNVQILEWRPSPLTVVLGLNAPDSQLLTALQDSNDNVSPYPQLVGVPDSPGYLTALRAWETECRETEGTGFLEELPAFANAPIPWAQFVDSSSPAAANDNWVVFTRLAAASADGEDAAICLEDPGNTPAQWTLTLAAIDGTAQTLVVFRVNAGAIAAFHRHKIKLRIGGDIVNMGTIDEEGQAEIILSSPVPMKGLAISWEEDRG